MLGQMTENKKYLKVAYFSNAAVLAPGVLLFIVWLHSCDLLHRFRDDHKFLLTHDDHTHQRCNSVILYVLCCLLAHLVSLPWDNLLFFF